MLADQHQIVGDHRPVAGMAVQSRHVHHGMGQARRCDHRCLRPVEEDVFPPLLPEGPQAAVTVGERAVGGACRQNGHLGIPPQQRVAVARALAHGPKLIIADEPTGNIDPQLSYEIVELLRKINRQNGTTIIMVTHEHDLVKYFGGRIINIENGSITFDENIGGASDEDE